MSTGTLKQIWIKPEHGGEMQPQSAGTLDTGKGLAGDVNHGGRRQVTVIDADHWKTVEASLGAAIDPSARRANIMVSGVPLKETKGRTLRIGGTLLRVKGETRPCMLMDQAFDGLQEALRSDWGGGVYCDVIEGGPIQISDPVSWETS